MRRCLLLLTIFAVGCSESKPSCGGKVLVLWPSSTGEYQPTVVATPTLRDARVLKGPVANVYFEARTTDRGFAGQPAEPHLTSSGDVCVPTDVGSAVAVSAYAQFERLYAFDQQLGVDGQISWPRHVGVETRLNGAVGKALNNAHYMGDKDLVLLVPSTMPGVPVAMNLGVVAHEHFHAHFQSQVLNALAITSTTNLLVNLLPTFLTDAIITPASTETIEHRANDWILRGWNEGLADLYAAVYTKRPDFLSASFGDGPQAQQRYLNGAPAVIGTGAIMAKVRAARDAGAMSAGEREALSADAYGQGVALARALWAVVHDDPTTTPEQNLTKLMKSLKNLPAVLNGRVGATALNSSFILPVLLNDVNLSPAMCQHLMGLVAREESLPRWPQCGSY